MVIMNLLRMLVDLSFYGAFAGLIARACGGNGAIPGIMIQCACFALSRLGGSRRGLRMVLLLPILLGWLIHVRSPADCVLLLPAAAYIIWLVWKNDYVLDAERQRLLFGVFWKVLAGVLVFGMLLGGADALTAVTVPYGLIVLTGSVLLMRALRHEPKVYCGMRYQIINLSMVAVVAAVAGLLSTKAFLNACAAAFRGAYHVLIRPVLEFLLNLLLYLLAGIARLFSMLSLRKGEQDMEEVPQLDLSGAENIFGDDIQMREPSELLRILGIILLVAAAGILLVLFFRWLNRRGGAAGAQSSAMEEREKLETVQRTVRKRETSPVRKIRAQYRAFLKWCGGLHLSVERSSTSLDIHEQASAVSGKEEALRQIRELYIKARYAEEADRDDVRKMKQLCERLKQSDKD